MARWRSTGRLASLACASLVALALACASPTLPLPPPGTPTVSVGTEPSTYRLRSEAGALPNALVIAVNRNLSLSNDARVEATLADEEGSWELIVTGRENDVVDISQGDGSARSSSTSVTLR